MIVGLHQVPPPEKPPSFQLPLDLSAEIMRCVSRSVLLRRCKAGDVREATRPTKSPPGVMYPEVLDPRYTSGGPPYRGGVPSYICDELDYGDQRQACQRAASMIAEMFPPGFPPRSGYLESCAKQAAEAYRIYAGTYPSVSELELELRSFMPAQDASYAASQWAGSSAKETPVQDLRPLPGKPPTSVMPEEPEDENKPNWLLLGAGALVLLLVFKGGN